MRLQKIFRQFFLKNLVKPIVKRPFIIEGYYSFYGELYYQVQHLEKRKNSYRKPVIM